MTSPFGSLDSRVHCSHFWCNTAPITLIQIVFLFLFLRVTSPPPADGSLGNRLCGLCQELVLLWFHKYYKITLQFDNCKTYKPSSIIVQRGSIALAVFILSAIGK